MTRPFQWGIVGTGGIARQFRRRSRLAAGRQRSSASARATSSKAKAFQSEFGAGARLFGPRRDARDPDIDVIYIATPNALHAEQALRAIAHGKAVLVEKPLATSVADAERIGRGGQPQNCFVMEGMWTRFLPAVRAAKKLVEDGAIGEIRQDRAELSYRRDEDRREPLLPARSRRRRGARPRRLSGVAGAAFPGQARRRCRGAGRRRNPASTCAANSTSTSSAARGRAFLRLRSGWRQSVRDRGERRRAGASMRRSSRRKGCCGFRRGPTR